MTKQLLSLGLLSSLFLAQPAYALFSMPEGDLLLEGGGYYTLAGEEQKIEIEGVGTNKYTVDHNFSGSGLLGLGFLYHTVDKPSYKLDLGWNLFFLFKTRVYGDVLEQEVNKNLDYVYELSHIPLYLEARNSFRIISDQEKYFLTLSAGVGPNWMKTNHYREHQINDSGAIPQNPYSGQTQAVFSATGAIGIKINEALGTNGLEFGYRFFYLGQGEFNNRYSNYEGSFKTGPVFSNSLVITVNII